MTWTWIYAFTGLTGTLWVLLTGLMAGIGGGDAGAEGGLDGIEGGFDGGLDGIEGGLDGGLDGIEGGLDGGMDVGADGGLDGAEGLDAGSHALEATGIDAVDAGHAVGEVQPGFPFFSPYVISSFLAGFGIAGYASITSGLGLLLHLPIALAVGVGLGGVVGTFFHKLRTVWSQSSETQRRHLLGATAEVSISIPDHKVGEVSLVAAGTRRSMAARSITGVALPVGTTVRIERLDGSTAIVREPAGDRLERLGSSADPQQQPES